MDDSGTHPFLQPLMLSRIRELVVVEGSHDVRAIKQTMQATVLAVGGWGAKRPSVIRFLQTAERKGKGILFFMDSDETGTAIESFLRSKLMHPEKALSALLLEEISTSREKIGLEHAKPCDVLHALQRAGGTFLNGQSSPSLSLSDLRDLGLKDDPQAPYRRSKLCETLGMRDGNAKHFLEQANFLDLTREDLEVILGKKDPA